MTPVIDLYDQTAHQEDGSSAWWYKRIDRNGAEINLGQVSFVKLTATGSGYSSPPSVDFSGGGGNGASATALISHGKVVAIRLDSPGAGYTSAPVVALNGGGGSGASAQAYWSDSWHKGFGRIKSDFDFTQDETPVYDEGKTEFAFKKEVLKGTIVFTSIQDDAFTENFLSKEVCKYYWTIFQHAGLSRENFQKYRYIGIVKIPRSYKSAVPGREPELKGLILSNNLAISVMNTELPMQDLIGSYSLAACESYSVQEEVKEPVF